MATNPYMTKANKIKRDSGGEVETKSSSSANPYLDRANKIKSSQPIAPILPPTIEATPKKSGFLNSVFGEEARAEYDRTHKDTPDWLKPIGFGLETFNRIPLTNRLMNKSSEFLGVDRVNFDSSKMETMSTGNKAVDALADVGGNLLGAAMTSGGGGKSLLNATDDLSRLVGGKVATKTSNKLLPAIARGAIDGGASVALEDISKGNFENLPQDVAINMLGGGVLVGGGQAIGDIARKFTPKVGKLLPDFTSDLYNVNTKDMLSDLVTTSSKVSKNAIQPLNAQGMDFSVGGKPLRQLETPKAEVAASVEPKASYAKIEQPDIKPSKIDISNATIEPPDLASIDGDSALFKESKFKSNTLKNAEMLQGEEVQKTIDNIHAMYEVKTDIDSVTRANVELSSNPQNVIDRIRGAKVVKENELTELTKEDVVASGIITNQLRQEAESTGDYTKLKDWLETVQPRITNIAQSLQAVSTWKKLTPEGALMKAQQVVGKVNREGEKAFGKSFKKVELTADEIGFINDIMKKVELMPDGREKDVALEKVKNIIADKIPPTLAEKVRAIRNISLLLNSKTFVRNVVGNALMGVGDNAANTLSATLLRPLDDFMSKITGVKTVAIPSLKTQGKGFKEGGKVALSDSLGGLSVNDLKGKTLKEQAKIVFEGALNPIRTDNISTNKFEIRDGLTFKNKPMRLLENALNTSLSIGDKPFSQAYYDDVVNQLKKANNLKVLPEDLKKVAEKVAQERTYQDINSISYLAQGIKSLPKQIQDHPRLAEAIQIFVDALVPYTKTPSNILKRGLEFTPVGVLEGVIKLGTGVKNKSLTAEMQREIMDRISRGLVGGGIIVGGLGLANSGLLTGAADKDKDVANFESQIGKQPFAVKVGDKNISYSQYQPLSMPLGAAAQMSQSKKQGTDTLTALADSASSALNYYADQPMLQSIQRFLGNSYSDKGIGQRVIDASLELPKQFVPTALKQVAQTMDDTQRSSYSPNYLDQQLLNPIKAKLPGLSKQLEPKIDTLGNDVKQFQGDNSLFNILLNPGYTTKENASSVQDLIMNTYKETGDKTIFPRVAANKITYKGSSYTLEPSELTQFQRYIGQRTNDMVSSQYSKLNNMTAENRAKELQKIITKVYDEGKKQILAQRGVY